MARQQAFRDNPELQQFLLPEAHPTGRQLGVGSYGSVEELQVKGLVCAGKRLHEALLERDNDGVTNIERRYLEECQVMAKLRHPHVVQFLGLCYLPEGSTLPVLVMERLDSSLDELLEGVPGLPLALKRSLLSDVVCGLHYLHTHDPPIVHRDLTCRNILLTSSLVAKISDLGNARIVNLQPGQLSKTLTRLPGTRVYMPPEAFHEGSRYGPPLDIFSYGHLALFTLTQVFPGSLLPSTYPDPENLDNLLARSELERRRDYIQQLNGMLGEEHPLVQLVQQCLHNIPDRRPPAGDILQQLEAAKTQIEGPYGQIVKVNLDLEKVRALREKDTQIRHLRQQIQQMEVQLEAKDAQLRQKDGQLQQQSTELQERDTQIGMQQRELMLLREDKCTLQAEVESKIIQAKESATQINMQQKELQTLRDDKGRLQAEVESNIAKFQQHAQEKDAEISRLQRELQTLRDQNVTKDERLTAVQSQFQQLQMELDARVGEIQQQLQEKGADDIDAPRNKLTDQTVSKDQSVDPLRSSEQLHKPTTLGLCGLSNLGNTCYMNSALQCLSNTQPLTEYFLGTTASFKPYMKHLNRSNPLGMGGVIAESCGALLEEIWSGKYSCVLPRHFKTQVDHCAPTILVRAQHDSQELLVFLLNGLHEDLNLVKQKPDIDMTVKTEGKDDKDIAEESWHKYLQRNQSVIVRVFQGQLKSTLTCPACKLVSKIFDPFMFLSLPVVRAKPTGQDYREARTMVVCLVRADPAREVYRFKLKVPKKGCISHLKNELSKLTDVSTDLMMVVDVYNSRFHRIYADRESLLHILDRDDIYIYELSHHLNNQDWVHVPVYHREEVVRQVKYTFQSYTQCYHQLFGLPLMVRVPHGGCTYRNLYCTIVTWCRRYVRTWVQAMAADEGSEEEEKKEKEEKDLFQLVVVNSYGSQEVQRLKDDDKNPLKLSSQTYIACNWQTDVKDKCYDLDAAQLVLDHDEQAIQLGDCIKLFTKRLDEEDAWYCLDCKDFVQGSKKFDLWKLPEILVIHLKRFSYERYSKEKANVLVEFPVNGLDLTEYCQNPSDPQPVYDLFAVSNHFGEMDSGHYTAYCKNKDSGKWYNFDDNHVSEISESHLVTDAAYVLFYRRRTEGTPTHTLALRAV